MKSVLGKRMLNLLAIALCPVAIGFVHWKYFFPRSAHSDFRFQLVGECLELLVLGGIFVLAYFGFANERRQGEAIPLSNGKKALGGVAIGITSIVLAWREFFPNDQFKLSAGIDALTFSLFMGLFMYIYWIQFSRESGKAFQGRRKVSRVSHLDG